MKKALLSLLLAAMLLCGIFSATAEDAPMTDGYYYYLITEVNNESFIHFNADGTYYASYLNGAALDAGTWELVDQAVEYYEDVNGDGVADPDDGKMLTSEKAVILHSFLSGNEQVIAFADDTLQDMDLGGGMAHHRNLAHRPEYAYNPDVDETPITIAEFYAHGSTGDAIFFGHDGSFTDGTGDILRFGTWTVADTNTYNLVFDDEEDGTGSIVFNESRTAATMTVGEEVTELVADVNAAEQEAPLYLLNGSLEVEHPEYGTIPYEIAGEMNPDHTVVLSLAAFGNSAELDRGTWDLADNGYTMNFVFEKAGEIASELNMETFAVTVPYALAGSDAGDIACDLLLTENPDAQAGPVTVEHTLAGSFTMQHPDYGEIPYEINGEMYSDSSVKLTIGAYGNYSELDQGTWALEANGYTVRFAFEKAGEILSDLNFETHVVTVHYVLENSEQAGPIDTLLTVLTEGI